MKAIVCSQYGPPDVLRLEEIPIPVPADDEVLIKVHAAAVNPLDSGILQGPWIARLMSGGLRAPRHKVLGADVAGRVEAVGGRITQFKPGDDVFAGLFGGLFAARGLGGFAEYVCAVQDQVAMKPLNLSFLQAAAVPVAAITALQGLRDKGHIRPGQRVLVDGASGGVGTFAVQIAKSFGAEVTAVCSTGNLQQARFLGADHVIDYTVSDFTRSGQRYDLILAANAHHSVFDYRRALSPSGIFVMVGGGLPQMLQALIFAPLLSWLGARKMGSMLAKINQQDLIFLKVLIEAGKIHPVLDRCYPLSDAAEALRYLGKGHAHAKVVIAVEPGSLTPASPLAIAVSER
jgi:NADPH:quinone reductase-like Zn-dependent oxidoreductase